MLYKEMLTQYFVQHRREMVDDICRLICIESVKSDPQPGKPYGPGPAAALDCAMVMAKNCGFHVTDFDHRLLAVDLNKKPHQLDIWAHLDVVPGGDDWTVTEPFDPIVRDGRIYGRGSSDDKGPAIAALYAMRAVKELSFPLKKNVRLILGSDEERGMSDKAYYCSRQSPAPMAFSPDAWYPIINVEKGKVGGSFHAVWEEDLSVPRVAALHSGLQSAMIPSCAKADIIGLSAEELQDAATQVTEQTGIRFSMNRSADGVHVLASGIGGHTAEPEGSNNALTGLLALLDKLPLGDGESSRKLRSLAEMFPHGDLSGKALCVNMENRISGDLSLSLSVLHMENNALDGQFDTRIPLQATPENTVDVLVSRMNDHGIQLECTFRPAHHVSDDSALVKELLYCYENYTGRKAHTCAIGGSTYVHGLSGGVAFGCVMPGVDTHMHGADEFMDIDALMVSAQMFAQAIIDLCG